MKKSISDYISEFEEKHNVSFEEWVCSIGGIALLSDFYVDYKDIKFDIDTKQHEDNFIEWYDITLDKAMQNKTTISYKEYCKFKKKKHE